MRTRPKALGGKASSDDGKVKAGSGTANPGTLTVSSLWVYGGGGKKVRLRSAAPSTSSSRRCEGPRIFPATKKVFLPMHTLKWLGQPQLPATAPEGPLVEAMSLECSHLRSASGASWHGISGPTVFV